MQFQHGTYSKAANGSLTLSPIAVDGRQLLSNPCSYDSAIYTRYNQTELFLVRLSGPTSMPPSCFAVPSRPPKGARRLTQGTVQRYEVGKDLYHNVQRLNLFKFDGSPMNPMYLAYRPPQMLPTETLHPATATGSGGAKSTGKSKVKRSLGADNAEAFSEKILFKGSEPIDADRWWWIGVGMTGLGGVLYFCF